ncbi:hypothetical protein [Leptolyngbya sp. FACHB-17]|uniref:hypothetical protein n=1 Tax=unclassified Leptolyngbya TaxID=2650499 RepID=UPI0016818271|nr:hypothetical protein [Leptolyngbya sp. FACHB-17]MBD2081565.1 hypothetical protein [Leptolyngbya sp. FACHB-17]
MKWLSAFVLTIVLLLTSSAIAQTDININNKNLIRLGGDVTVLEKQVVENAHAIGGSVTVQPNARVTQTAIAIGGNVTLKRGARVDGDAYAVGGNVVQEEGATIGGAKQTFNEDAMRGMQRDRHSFWAGYAAHSIFRIMSAIVSAIAGMILLRAAPSFLPNLAATVHRYPSQSALWGIGASITLVALILFLAITLIGIPLIPLLILVASLATFVGTLGISLWVGQQITKSDQRTRLQQFLIGLLIITLLSLVPVLGGIVTFIVSLFGLGALLAWKVGRVQPLLME